jgi:NAD(P)-dependent dehydrogenase (short-subunit alcohol dehydrogenase family)
MKNKVVLITGGASGIGSAAARVFSVEGARVAVADVNDEQGEAVCQEVRLGGGEAYYISCDMTDDAAVKRCVDELRARFERLDVLYNNIGGSTPADGPVTSVELDEFWRAMRLDVFSTILASRHAIPLIAAGGGGAVVNTTSYTAMLGVAGRDCYTAAKGAIISLTRSMAVEYAPQNIRVNAVSPGAVDTERLQRFLKNNPDHPTFDVRNRHRRPDVASHMMGIVKPADVAHAALFLASEEAARITGTILSVDSGATAW